MVPGEVRRLKVWFVALLGGLLIAVAIALNIGWIVVNWRTGLLLLVGIVSFSVLIVGLCFNTAFLIREIGRTERHNAFIHAVTHELKTPLASIRLYLQTLRQRDVDPVRQQEFIETMLTDVARLQSTIDQVLITGKTGRARRVVNPIDVNLSEVIGECVTVAGQRHHFVNDEVQVVDLLPQGESAIVMGDREEIQAAIANLIDNAIKYSGERVRVAVELVKLGARRVAINVKDQGTGITRQELKRIFRRFYRIPGTLSARVRGTGLGLSIVRAVARRHGGRAYAASEGSGKGSRFTLELPLKPL
jgi:signal transduction histidine kinase